METTDEEKETQVTRIDVIDIEQTVTKPGFNVTTGQRKHTHICMTASEIRYKTIKRQKNIDFTTECGLKSSFFFQREYSTGHPHGFMTPPSLSALCT